MISTIIIYIIVYGCVIVCAFVGEIAYRQMGVKEAIKDYRRIVARSSLIYIVFAAASMLYHYCGSRFSE